MASCRSNCRSYEGKQIYDDRHRHSVIPVKENKNDTRAGDNIPI